MNNLIVRKQETLITQFIGNLDVMPKSKQTYTKALKQFMQYLEVEGITEPSRQDILAYKQYLLDHYKAGTVSSYLTAVRALFTYLESEKIYPNVAKGVKGPKSGDTRKEHLTVGQAKRLLASLDTGKIEGLRNYAIINLLLHTGLRTIEINRALIGDIRKEGGEALLYIQGKGRQSKDSFVVLTESTLYPIQQYLNARATIDPKAPLFVSHSDRSNGEALSTRSISWIVKEALKAVGLNSENLTAHSLRHTAVTFSLLAGATIQEAQAMARHSNINTTLIYAHNIDRIAKAPERKIAEMLAL